MKPTFRRLTLLAAVLASLLPAGGAAAQDNAGRMCDQAELRAVLDEPGRVSFVGRISLVPPPGTRSLIDAEIDSLLPFERGNLVLVNDSGTVISIMFTQGAPTTQQSINRFATPMEYYGMALGEFRWVRRGEQVRLGGTRWQLYEYTLRDREGRVHHVRHYWTRFQTHGLAARFATTSDRADRAATAASAATLRVFDCLLPGDRAAPQEPAP